MNKLQPLTTAFINAGQEALAALDGNTLVTSLSETGCKVTSALQHLPDHSVHQLRFVALRVLWDADSVPFDTSVQAAFLAAAGAASAQVCPRTRPVGLMTPAASTAVDGRCL